MQPGKQKEHEFIEFRENAPPAIRFRPVSVAETPAAIEELRLSYRAILNQHQIQPLVGVGALYSTSSVRFAMAMDEYLGCLRSLACTSTDTKSGASSAWKDWLRNPAMSITKPRAKAQRAGTKGNTI